MGPNNKPSKKNKAARERMLAELKDVIPKPIDPQKLHSFTFPTSLAWNGQRILRFISPVSSKTGEMPPPPPRSKTASPEQDNSPEPRSKTASPEKNSPLLPRSKTASPEKDTPPLTRSNTASPEQDMGKEEEAFPWNLRRRRENQNENQNNEVLKLGLLGKEDSGERKTKLTIALTAKEIEADFLAMAGKKPARRPKKRAKRIQQQIDDIFPGMRLSKITPELYEVDEHQD